MPGVNFQLYPTGKEALITDNPGQIVWSTDTIMAVLLKPSYVFNANHATWADVSAHQITDPGYAPIVVSGKTSALVGTKVRWSCSNLLFGNPVTLTAKTVLLVKRTSASLAPTDPIICSADLNDSSASATVSSSNNIFQVSVSNGLFDI